jgi:virginiamycin B lyase
VTHRLFSRAVVALFVTIVAVPALAGPAVAEAGQVSVYPLADSFAGPFGITSGPDGNVWFTEQNTGRVGKMAPDGTFLADYPTTYGDLRYIRPGPDGNLWFTEYGGAGAIGRVTPNGTLSEFVIPTHFNRPYAIAPGPDGRMWFTEDGNKIGRISMKGSIKEFVIPTPQSLPDQITAGPDGYMWFTEGAANKLARINPSTGAIQEFKLRAGSNPSGIVLGPDGHLWITEQSGPPGKIARVDGFGGGHAQVTEFPLTDQYAQPFNITVGPDGNLWFNDVGANVLVGQIGRITTAGVITLFDPGTTRTKSLIDITAGPDGRIWYGLYWSSEIAAMTTT